MYYWFHVFYTFDFLFCFKKNKKSPKEYILGAPAILDLYDLEENLLKSIRSNVTDELSRLQVKPKKRFKIFLQKKHIFFSKTGWRKSIIRSL